jgi:hypothetical protein
MMQASPSAPNEAVDKASSILLLSPTLELARAFLSGTSLAPSYSARLCRIMSSNVHGARMLVADSLVATCRALCALRATAAGRRADDPQLGRSGALVDQQQVL